MASASPIARRVDAIIAGRDRAVVDDFVVVADIDAELECVGGNDSEQFALGGQPKRSRLCPSLQDACREPYFYESFFGMAQTRIPFGESTYSPWRAEIDEQMQKGNQIWYLGQPA